MSDTFVTPWTIAHKAPLPTGFSRQEYWSGFHFFLQGIFPTQGWNLCLLHFLHWMWILYHWATWPLKPPVKKPSLPLPVPGACQQPLAWRYITAISAPIITGPFSSYVCLSLHLFCFYMDTSHVGWRAYPAPVHLYLNWLHLLWSYFQVRSRSHSGVLEVRTSTYLSGNTIQPLIEILTAEGGGEKREVGVFTSLERMFIPFFRYWRPYPS